MAKNRSQTKQQNGKRQVPPAKPTHTGKKDKVREAQGDALDPIIAFLKPFHEKNQIPKRLVNVVILLRSAFPGRCMKKSIIKRAYLKAGWDINTLCTLTNNELANAIERGELDASYNEPRVRVDAVEPPKDDNYYKVKMVKVKPQPATSQQGYPKGYFEDTQTAGPKKRWSKAYPSMFYNDPLLTQVPPKSKKQNGRAPLAPARQPTTNASSKQDTSHKHNPGNGATSKNQQSEQAIANAIAAKHNRFRNERVHVRATPLGVNSVLKIVTEMNNTLDMPKKLIRVRDLIRSENPGVWVKKSTISKAYHRAGWNKKELKAVSKRNMTAPKERNDDPRPLRKLKFRPFKRVVFRRDFRPRKAAGPQVAIAGKTQTQTQKPVIAPKPRKVFKPRGTTGRRHRVLHETANAAMEERRKTNAVNKKVAVAMDRLQRRKR